MADKKLVDRSLVDMVMLSKIMVDQVPAVVVDTDLVTEGDMLVVVMIGDHTIQTSIGSKTRTGEDTLTDRCTTCRTW